MNKRKIPDTLTFSEALPKAMHYCAYQERSSQQLREKLTDWGLEGEDMNQLIERLKKDNFLNDERFALSYAGGKFRLKSWGRRKIRQGLLPHRLPEELVRKALLSLDGDAYYARLKELLVRKNNQLKDADTRIRQQKLLRYAASKGFEQDIIWDALHEIQQA